MINKSQFSNKLYDVWRVTDDQGLEFFKTAPQSEIEEIFATAKKNGRRLKLRILKEGDTHWIFSMSGGTKSNNSE
jgi:hypothetical protein